jgi:Anti-sigma-K factor rskA
VTDEHQAVQEILAARALHSLDDAERGRAEGLLASHLPTCAECRALLDGFEATAGDLALATGPRSAPFGLRVRLRRHLDPDRLPTWSRVAVAACAVAAVAGLGLWNAHLTGRVRAEERHQADTADLLATVSHPSSHVVALRAESGSLPNTLAASYVPGRPMLYVFGSLPDPAEGSVYKVWLLGPGVTVGAAVFRPEGGLVLVRVGVDARRFHELLITEETRPEATRPMGPHVVRGTLG